MGHCPQLAATVSLQNDLKSIIMPALKEMAREFLEQKNLAVVGVSRDSKKTANFIYRKLRSEGYRVFAVNPNTTTAEGDPCYPDLKSIPEKIGVAIMVTKPNITEQSVRECAALGINKVWMHQGMDAKATSVSPEAVSFCRENGIQLIPGACPMMFCNHADMGHRLMRWMQGISGSLPRV